MAETPDIVTNYVARICPVDYAVYILSSFSFWFGFSALGFLVQNPFIKKPIEAASNRHLMANNLKLSKTVKKLKSDLRAMKNLTNQLVEEVAWQSSLILILSK